MVFILNIFDQLIMAKAEIAAIEIAYTSPPANRLTLFGGLCVIANMFTMRLRHTEGFWA